MTWWQLLLVALAASTAISIMIGKTIGSVSR